MKSITRKLKRYKILYFVLSIVFLPIRIPLILFILLGDFLEEVLGCIDCHVYKTMDKIAEVFKWDEIAEKKYY
jgi:hypothetical protein